MLLGRRMVKHRASRMGTTIAVGLCVFVASIAGCGASTSTTVDAPYAGLPVWEGSFRVLFDDDIEPPSSGLLTKTKSARTDPVLRERARTADWVGRLRVSTVTAQTLDGTTTYRIVVQALEAPFITPKISDTSWELVVGPTASGYQLTRAYENRLRDSRYIGFLRQFVNAGGELELHWHLSPDTQDVAAAVGDALGLAELSGT